jgi:hypothetical protein
MRLNKIERVEIPGIFVENPRDSLDFGGKLRPHKTILLRLTQPQERPAVSSLKTLNNEYLRPDGFRGSSMLENTSLNFDIYFSYD